MSSSFNIGFSSLFASKCALMITNQNIANADNPSYSRRVINFKEISDNGYGNGVQVFDINRVVDNAINKSLVQSTSLYAASDVCSKAFKAYEPQLDTGSNSLSTNIQQSLNQLNNLNARASSIQDRNAYLYQLSSMTQRFNQLGQQINAEKQNINQMITDDVDELNNIAKQIAQINIRIASSTSPSAGPANLMLLDERDALLNQMAQFINVDSFMDDRGMVNVKLSNGISLVFGGDVATLATMPSLQDHTALDVVIKNNESSEVITSFITSGEIAGFRSFQHNGLEASQRGLDRLALSLSFALNAQNKMGMDLNGNLGQNIFRDMNAPDIAAQRVMPSAKNTGTGGFSVDIQDARQLTTSQYHILFDSPTHYSLVRESDNVVVGVSDIPNGLSVDGFTVNLTNANFHTGDSFLVIPTFGASNAIKMAITDPRQLALAFPVSASAAETNSGSGMISVMSITDTTTSTFAAPGKLSPPITVQFISPTQYSLVNSQTGAQIGNPVQYDPLEGAVIFPTADGYDPGYRVNLSGEMSTGDQFIIDYNRSGAEDNRNGLQIAELYRQGQLDNGSLNFIQGYHAVSSDISSKTNVANMIEATQSIIQSQAQLRRDQVSGVSLEEEMSNVALYQQSYQASARILETVTTMFDILINLGRR